MENNNIDICIFSKIIIFTDYISLSNKNYPTLKMKFKLEEMSYKQHVYVTFYKQNLGNP